MNHSRRPLCKVGIDFHNALVQQLTNRTISLQDGRRQNQAKFVDNIQS